ncbi:MAG: hypothetical protein MUP82_08065, partial [Candidatus Marinimicrobia bacterium]|nr:hypothetical protein [Candidatus Neomarinimicrobiota bacterium]
TNSNQTATNIFDVTGQINVIGAHTFTMNFMMLDVTTDPPSFVLLNLTDENQNAILMLDGNTGEGMLITNINGQTFFGNVTFAYNNGTLTVTQSTITDVASAATVTISGSLSFNQTNIPANTSTFLEFNFDEGDPGEGIGLSTIKFNNDGTATVTTIDEDGTEIENWTYATDGNQLTITDEFNETMVWEYSVTGNTLTLAATDFEDYCGDFNTQAECFAETEEFFNLTPGSLTAVTMQVEIVLNQAAAKPGLNIGRNINLINPTKMITDYKVKIDNIKQNL